MKPIHFSLSRLVRELPRFAPVPEPIGSAESAGVWDVLEPIRKIFFLFEQGGSGS